MWKSQNKSNNYTAEFKQSAVKLATESDQPVAQTAKELGVNQNTLYTWITIYAKPKEKQDVQADEH
ncbi:MAG: transposase, partial [Methyloprofundus sp.]|nr:transposase [Methyloprofundus sp.]